jgi:hypothetical protein
VTFGEWFGMEPTPEDPNPTVVVNLRRDEYDVYVGRPGKGMSGYFGNPVRRGSPCPECEALHQTRGSTLDCFEAYARRRIERDPEYRSRVLALWGKRLGCFCKPSRCHGDTLRDLAHELHEASAVG